MLSTDLIESKFDASLRDDFQEFYLKYYAEELNEILNHNSPSLTVDYNTLHEFDDNLASLIVEEPFRVYTTGRAVLRSLPKMDKARNYIDGAPYDDVDADDPSDRNPLAYVDLRFVGIPNTVQIRNIRASDITDMIKIEGRVKKKTEVLPKVDIAYYKCTKCGEYTTVKQPLDGGLEEPDNCAGCGDGGLVFDWDESHLINFERVEIEENPETLTGGETPQSIKYYNWGDTTGMVKPGERVNAIGILEPEAEDKSAIFDKRIRGINIEREEEAFEDLEISDEEIEEIEELASKDDIYDLVVNSMAPKIYGYDEQKFALALALFGGVPKEEGGSYIRGDIHTLSVGDPGTGKSELLEYAHTIAPRGVYTSGKGSSSAGLTAAAVQEESLTGESTWTLEAGALVLADKGIAAIDEIDKMESSDRDSLHEALQSQKISVNKAGINATLKARCAVLAAANPKRGEFEQYEAISEQIDLDPALISRFDLIFTITDTPNEETDSKIAEHILSANRSEENKGGEENEENAVQPDIPPDLFRKYVAYARNNCFPELTDGASDEIRDFYVELRQEGGEDVRSATARQLQSLIRLAEASARVRLSDTAEVRDAKTAIKITESSLEEVATDPETGEIDVGMVESGISTSKSQRLKELKNIISTLSNEYDGGVPKEEIFDAFEQNVKGELDEQLVEESLRELKAESEIYESETNQYKPVV